MLCPICKIKLKETTFHNVGVDFCPRCLGLWFAQEELRWAKDAKDKNLSWLDIDLWKDKKKFKISSGQKLCPKCELPLYEVNYGDSDIHPVKSAKGGAAKPQFNGVEIDLCNLCQGIWLDRGEFKKIIEYLREKANYEILNNYLKNLLEEVKEIFTGPETLKEEVLDCLAIAKILRYKFATQHPVIAKIISQLPR